MAHLAARISLAQFGRVYAATTSLYNLEVEMHASPLK